MAFPAQGVRLFHSLRAQQGKSTAILFVHIQSAYYQLLRHLSIGDTCNEAELCRVLHTLRLPATAFADLLKITTSDCAAKRLGISQQAHDQARSFHRNTWFHTRSSANVTRTLCGTRPGDGWADLVFNFVMVDVLAVIKSRLQQDNILFDLVWNGQRGPLAGRGNERADDLAFAFCHADSQILMDHFTRAAQIVIDELRNRGLCLNFGPGKTAAIINLRGRGSVARRRALFSPWKLQAPDCDPDLWHH